MRALAAILVVTLGAGAARAGEPDYFKNANDGSAIKLRREKSRTPAQKLAIGGLLLGAAISIGVGVYYNLDSREAANEVSANDDLTGETWTPALQDTYDRAGDSGTIAMVGYALGAMFLGGAIFAAWQTQPGEEQVTIVLAPRRAGATVTPMVGGAMVNGAWSW